MQCKGGGEGDRRKEIEKGRKRRNLYGKKEEWVG
jgi:hypothetical protein